MTTINGIELKPCPFCGEKEYLNVSLKSSLYFTKAVCNECGAGGPNSSSAELAIEAWNKRVTEPTPADDLAASVAGVADIPARREEDDLNKLDEA